VTRSPFKMVFRGPRQLNYEPFVLKTPANNQALIRAIFTGISTGTERLWYEGTNPGLRSGRRRYPHYPGYEFVGEVVEVGAEMRDQLAVSDLVFTMAPHSTHAVITLDDLWYRLPPSLTPANALAVALTSTSVHAAHLGALSAGDEVAVVGLGTLGLLMTQTLKELGSLAVVAVGRSPHKLELASMLGATAVVDRNDEAVMHDLYSSSFTRGVDLAVECAGESDALTVSIGLTRSQGRVVMAGLHQRPAALSGEDMFSKELSILGLRSAGNVLPTSEVNRWNRRANFKVASQLVGSGAVKLAPLITHRFDPNRAEEAYELIASSPADYVHGIFEWSTA
jgi:2-desacetyl-2-hydroxyethyl bacteriochlorophyllide A dehydrogenase